MKKIKTEGLHFEKNTRYAKKKKKIGAELLYESLCL